MSTISRLERACFFCIIPWVIAAPSGLNGVAIVTAIASMNLLYFLQVWLPRVAILVWTMASVSILAIDLLSSAHVWKIVGAMVLAILWLLMWLDHSNLVEKRDLIVEHDDESLE